jgi:hypothetical protein
LEPRIRIGTLAIRGKEERGLVHWKLLWLDVVIFPHVFVLVLGAFMFARIHLNFLTAMHALMIQYVDICAVELLLFFLDLDEEVIHRGLTHLPARVVLVPTLHFDSLIIFVLLSGYRLFAEQ